MEIWETETQRVPGAPAKLAVSGLILFRLFVAEVCRLDLSVDALSLSNLVTWAREKVDVGC